MVAQIKHEAEVTRQHARFRIPARLRAGGREYTLEEWSVSGFSATRVSASVGRATQTEGTMLFNMGAFTLATDIEFEVLRYDEGDGRIACRFVNLDRQKLSIFHYIINAYLAGELVTAGDVLHIAGRDDFVQKDFDKRLETPRPLGARIAVAVKRLVGYTLLTALFVALIGLAGYTVYQRLYIVEATSAQVSGPVEVLRAPDDGVFEAAKPLTPGDVTKGTLLGIVRLVGGGAASVESPCDCRLVRSRALDGTFVGQGEPIATLLHGDAGLFVEADVPFNAVADIRIGQPAEIRFPNGSRVNGVVREVSSGTPVEGRRSGATQSQSRYATVRIEPEEPIAVSMLDAVASVRVNTFANPFATDAGKGTR